ncbi:MAG TPA: hypothetical protein VEI02_16375 [Planctomycetota bacterium]|nr:hypothetical protein [Planctomycetota bacterium]
MDKPGQARSATTSTTEYPQAFVDAETALVEARRRAVGLEPPQADRSDWVGVACSGGGIRSATFCLGVFQALARLGLTRRIDLLSTVSGGGYFGSFYTRLFTRPFLRGQADVDAVLLGAPPPETAEDAAPDARPATRTGADAPSPTSTPQPSLATTPPAPPAAPNGAASPTAPNGRATGAHAATQPARRERGRGAKSATADADADAAPDTSAGLPRRPTLPPPTDDPATATAHAAARAKAGLILRTLRDNGRYLAPNGSGDALAAGAALLRNWVSVHVLLATALLAVLLSVLAVVRLAELAAGVTWRTFFATTFGGGADGPVWSPWILLAGGVFLFGALPLGAAYWFIDARPKKLAALILAAFAVLLGPLAAPGPTGVAVGAAGGVVAVATVVWYVLAGRAANRDRTLGANGLRRYTSERLARALAIAAAVGAFALVDTVGGSLYVAVWNDAGLAGALRSAFAGVFAAIAAAAGFGRRLAVLFGGEDGGRRRLKIRTSVAAWIAATVVLFAIFCGADLAAHALAARFGPLPDVGAPPTWSGAWPAPALAGFFLAASWFFGKNRAFVNRSSHHALYAARLTRAYLGASNPCRFAGADKGVTDVCPGDDLPARAYWRREGAEPDDATDAGTAPTARGAPLHVVNLTVNETYDAKQKVQQQDRKGTGLAVGPAGFSLGVRHHARMDWETGLAVPEGPEDGAGFGKAAAASPAAASGADCAAAPCPPAASAPRPFRAFAYRPGARPEPLTVGAWVALSGAAFTTGLGARTSFGLSLLCGLANVRLGYWWDAGVDARETGPFAALPRRLFRAFSVHLYLLSEFVARFPGTAWPGWYLSDGGHFENMGAYELLRRRLRRIVIVDAEQDGAYAFEGLANLVRKARLDFGARIEFQDAAVLGDAFRDVVGPLDALRRDAPDRPSRLAAVAKIVYADGSLGTLVYLKPAHASGAPADVAHYRAANPEFPHEPTSDQFFDEAQWESYRALGELAGLRVFDAGDGGGRGWRPRDVFAGDPLFPAGERLAGDAAASPTPPSVRAEAAAAARG